MNNDLVDVGVLFTSKKLTTKSGKDYFSGRTDDAPEGTFNLMGFLRVSKSGTKYISIVRTDSGAPKAPEGGDAVNPPVSAEDDGYWDDVLSTPED